MKLKWRPPASKAHRTIKGGRSWCNFTVGSFGAVAKYRLCDDAAAGTHILLSPRCAGDWSARAADRIIGAIPTELPFQAMHCTP
jgi:hypothetical protein